MQRGADGAEGWRRQTAGRVKLTVARLLTSAPASAAINTITRDRLPYRGVILDTCGASLSSTTKAQLFWGIYEGAESRFIREFLCGFDVVVELGSGLGITGSLISRTMSAGGHLVCVEANPELQRTLQQMILNNKPPDLLVDFKPVAISSKTGAREMILSADVISSRLVDTDGGAGLRMVETTTLTELLSDLRIEPHQSVALVSDIEGSEAGIIFGQMPTLQRFQRIVIELHDTEVEGRPVTVEQMIQELVEPGGFEVLASRGPVLALQRRAEASATERVSAWE
jgi:FkbM family methyltransferase